MNDLISRQAAIRVVCEKDCYMLEPCASGCEVTWALEELPTAEPELIRCKDCKWFGQIGCAIGVVDDTDKPTENDYCSFAERKEE